ncbi:hypothetical protein ACFQZW_11545 [Lutibacter aestuarii]|uniref:Cardiolipin synthase N-terminal domain-containing protein n=1 Tax=Lutibacter aestuarii TaxID=861111 RepID=A0ABW2Z7Z0_9FLAO
MEIGEEQNSESKTSGSKGCANYFIIALILCVLWFLKGFFSWRGFDALRGLQEVAANVFLIVVFGIVGVFFYMIFYKQ